MYRITMFFLLALFLSHPVWAFDESRFTRHQLDTMLSDFKAARENTVEITLFRPLQFNATVVGLPQPKKTAYLQRLLRDFSQGEPPAVSHGMRVRSEQGKEHLLYVMDELVPKAEALLIPGDRVTLYAYHAYNAPQGPGLVLKSFLRHPRPTPLDKAISWFRSLTGSQE